jgi:hypothetical protein
VLELLPRLLAGVGAAANLIAIFFMAVIAVFVAYIGIAMRAILRAHDVEEREIRYKVFQSLLRLFMRRKHR